MTKVAGAAQMTTADVDAMVDDAIVTAADGTRLATTIYVPRGGARRHPTVMFRVPYGRAGEVCAIPSLAGVLVERGFAVVAQDVRGKFDSGGQRAPFVHEVSDGRDTLEWIATRSWSDGSVVAIGDSYPGFTAWAAGVSAHRALRAVIPRMTTTRVADGWLYRQGAFRLQLVADWAMFAWSQQGLQQSELDWSVRPLRDLLLPSSPDGRHPLATWVGRRPGSGWQRETLQQVNAMTAPLLGIGGWWDVFSRGQVRDWARQRRSQRNGSFLIMRSVDHEFHERTGDRVVARGQGGREGRHTDMTSTYADVIDFLAALMDDQLHSIPAVRWELTHGSVMRSDAWPPAEARLRQLYLVDGARAPLGPEGGGLSDRPDLIPSVAAWIHDPADLIPSLEPDPWGLLNDPADERDVEIRDDMLTFTSAAFRDPVDLAGPVSVVLPVSSTAIFAMLVATLCDVDPMGRVDRIVEGAARVREANPARPVELDLGPTGYRLRPGHRLRLEIASSAFPRYLWEPGTDEDPWTATSGTRSEQRIELGPDGAHIRFFALPPADQPTAHA